MESWSKLISALAQLAWPILVGYIFYQLREPIKDLLPKIKKAKLFGQEVEINELIDKFQVSVQKSEDKIPTATVESTQETQILQTSAKDPKLAIILLAKDIEQELRDLYASMGMLNEQNYVSPKQALEVMTTKGYIPKNTISSLGIFEELKNALVHGDTSKNDQEIIRVLDIGTTLLRTLKAIPHEINIVYHPGVDIYADPKCENLIEKAKGLILETTSPGGIEKTHRIFPTTKIGYYKKGDKVSWEWSFKDKWLDTWYKDPDTHKIKQAWNSSSDFIGRRLKEV